MSGKVEGMSGGKSAWMAHVKKTMRANKGKPLSAVLKIASKSFKGSRKTAKKSARRSRRMRGGGASSAAPGAGSAAPVSGSQE